MTCILIEGVIRVAVTTQAVTILKWAKRRGMSKERSLISIPTLRTIFEISKK